MKNKLMEVYDEYYNELFNKALLKLSDIEQTKKLLGQIFTDTWKTLTRKNSTRDDIKSVFSEVVLSHGIS